MNRRTTPIAKLVCIFAIVSASSGDTRASVPDHKSLTLDELLQLDDHALAKVDIATMNLVCTEGLSGSENVDRQALVAKLDLWARYVAYETERHRYRFERDPEEYNHSWGEFAMFMMAMTLQQDLNVRYNPDQITPEDDPSGFDFTRSQDLFINGLLNGTGGTCTSMPVLYIAVGRRLGYPLKLVSTADHTFLRWDDPESGERFNIEGTTRGYGSYPDEDYRSWPREWSDGERESHYLESLTPRQELAVFLTTRGNNLFFSGKLHDSLRCYDIARKMSPRNYSAAFQYKQTARLIERLAARRRAEYEARKLEEFYERHERRRRNDPRLFVPGLPTVPTANPVGRHPPNTAQQAHALLFPTAHPIRQGRPPVLGHAGTIRYPPTGRHNGRPLHSRTPLDALIAAQQMGSIMPEFQARIEAQNRRNEAIAKLANPLIHKLHHGRAPGTPRSQPPFRYVNPVPPQPAIPNPGIGRTRPHGHTPRSGAQPVGPRVRIPGVKGIHAMPRPRTPNYGARP